MTNLKTGDGSAGSDMGPLVTAVHRDKVAAYIDAGVNAGAKNPYESIRTTLGQFNYSIDPKTGNVSVKDTYDFNPMKNKAYQTESRGDYVVNMLDPLTIARAYGEARMPSGSGKGRPVSIQLPAGLLGR